MTDEEAQELKRIQPEIEPQDADVEAPEPTVADLHTQEVE